MSANDQIEQFGDKMRAAGAIMERLGRFVEPQTTRVWTRYRTWNRFGKAVTFVVVDLGADGYSLLIEPGTNRIDDDVDLLRGVEQLEESIA